MKRENKGASCKIPLAEAEIMRLPASDDPFMQEVLVNVIKLEQRRRMARKESRVKENVPANLKLLLGEIYKGHCQVCSFWFLKRDGTPYYEIHHISGMFGNHPQNLLLVCGNCHNQFTYADVEPKFTEGWLSKVNFNDREFGVTQIVFSEKFEEPTKQVFISDNA